MHVEEIIWDLGILAVAGAVCSVLCRLLGIPVMIAYLIAGVVAGPAVMEWVNPHAWMHLRVTHEDGSVDDWMIEAGPPGALVRRGWTRSSVRPGTEVLVEGYQATDGALRANGRDVTFPDGRRLFAGSSGTGAPLDGADPSEPNN